MDNWLATVIVIVALRVLYFAAMMGLVAVGIITIAYLLELHSASRFWPRRRSWLQLCILVQLIWIATAAYIFGAGIWLLLL